MIQVTGMYLVSIGIHRDCDGSCFISTQEEDQLTAPQPTLAVFRSYFYFSHFLISDVETALEQLIVYIIESIIIL